MSKEPGGPNIYGVSEPVEPKDALLEKERHEFLASLLLPEKKDVQTAISEAFMVDSGHLAVFITDLVYSLSPEKLTELQDLCSDISVMKAFDSTNFCISEMESMYEEGKGVHIKRAEDLLSCPKLLKIMTGKTVPEIDSIADGADLSILAGNQNLSSYIEVIKQLSNQMVAEKTEKYRDILEEDFGGEIPNDVERRKESLSSGYVSTQITERVKTKIAEFAKQQPMVGKKVFELGGSDLARTLGGAGAEAVNFDANGFDWKKWQFAEKKSDLKLVNTMNSENCMALLDQVDFNNPSHQFDLTTSRMVFDQGSGIESTTASGEYSDAAIELLNVLAKTTKFGGLSIHQTGGLEILGADEDQTLRQLGFEKVFDFNQNLADGITTHPYFLKMFAGDDNWTSIHRSLRSEGAGGNFTYPTVVLRRI